MNAPGGPGILPAWTRSNKDTVGTSLGSGRVWFTIGHGIVNEVFWPSCSTPQVRDLGFIVAGKDFWSEVKREKNYTLSTPCPDVPLPRIVHEHPRYRLELEVLADPDRDTLMVRYDLIGDDVKLYVLLAPHLKGSGHHNTALVQPRGLAAVKGSAALFLAAEHGFSRASAGYAGASDGWQDFNRNGTMTWQHERASDGNVALTGELNDNRGLLTLGFAYNVEGAQTLALSSLADGFALTRDEYVKGWQDWAGHLDCPGADQPHQDAVRRAAMVLKVHDDRTFPGAVVASLSTPWGYKRDDPGGYHLVWPRDAVEAGFAMLACGHHGSARDMLAYLTATQQPDGHWLQNFFADGRPYWTGIQLDEAAFPVLLASRLHELGELGELHPEATDMTRRALAFVARTGPSSPQDRWEENPGINPFTIAVAIAALVAGATSGFLEEADAAYALSLADHWNARLEDWLYASDTQLDRDHEIAGHYVRLAPPGQTAQNGTVTLKNRAGEQIAASDLLGMEYLYLVRLGLRRADDPRIIDTTHLVDALLRVETPTGPFYHRYNQDGYGEQADGSAFDGTGIGRAWPLLSGERGHYALLAGEDPMPYLDAMLASASLGGMIPEQVWDKPAIPERHLEPGRPSGSAMPLVWAHGEFIKLSAAIQSGKPVELITRVAERYRETRQPAVRHWRESTPMETLRPGHMLLVEHDGPFTLHVGHDGWQDVQDLPSRPTGLGMHGVYVDVDALRTVGVIDFTRRFDHEWEGRDWHIDVAPTSESSGK